MHSSDICGWKTSRTLFLSIKLEKGEDMVHLIFLGLYELLSFGVLMDMIKETEQAFLYYPNSCKIVILIFGLSDNVV